MTVEERAAIVEGMLFAAGNEGADRQMLANALECHEEVVAEALACLQERLDEEQRGVQLIEIAGVFQLTTRPEHFSYIERLSTIPENSTLSRAALETLAIIAYNQPITRPEIEDIRGVKCERAIQTLVQRELIEDRGRKEGSGRAILYGTTSAFLEHFGLKSIEGLPPLPFVEEESDAEEDKALFFDTLGDEQLS
ncbi:SMC-Scp complex subunit ScpB [Bacillaceae bacterium SIJ1]|uniref:SMC-Scp complex subunit ScpB n=1 Tax=Litoribacterium kuwaitense TaxID=1398745 RepID=UPI0013ED1A27|nr:SMC-Scp complex subunit ScpB [Litoribacterium kuwaitense]NGP43664.1 SMC-Scp complex subunit ScpB [Litoribacterium kuwaitense]